VAAAACLAVAFPPPASPQGIEAGAKAVPCPAVAAGAAGDPSVHPQCVGGLVYDDGGYEFNYGNPTIVQKFDLPAGTTSLAQACICFTRLGSAPSATAFQVIVYDDDGSGGRPGTFLGAASATATAIPLLGSYTHYAVSLGGAGITLPDAGVYVGVKYASGNGIWLCGDRSSGTPQRQLYGGSSSGAPWFTMAQLFPAEPPRALGIRVETASAPPPPPPGCTPSPTVLCLNGGRFKVEATFQPSGGAVGAAQVVQLTPDTGYLWFFAASNVEAVVKVLDGCPLNNRYWVFAGGLTNVRVVLRVTDTSDGSFKEYVNPQGAKYQPIQDTAAFATCP
jgi:hypothetical protein